MTDELVFYTNPMSRGRIVRWMLEEIDAPYRTELLAFGPEMNTPEYLALNPMGKVPCLRHGETVVTEAAAICAYLAEAFPEAGLAPRTNAERGPYYRWLFFAAGPLEQATTNFAMGFVVPEDKQGMSGYGSPERALNALETAVAQTPYVAGERFTAADVYVASHVGWGLHFGTIPDRPALAEYVARATDRPAWRSADARDSAAMGDSG